MAKETMIVFVYDTECCKEETDDPVNAVLYFHPSWVSDIQKLSLCGQLMGTTHFLKENFFRPKIISLQNGKFVLNEFGRFILAVGTDRNLSDSLLEHRADLLTSLVNFFHRDIQTIFDQFSINGQYKNLSEKLYHIFETYLPILQYNGNVFQNVPTLRLPKSASNIFLEAIQTLQNCQQTKGVLGGTILYHNKVVATQLSAEITKNLVLTDPYRIKSTAEPIIVDFYVPTGVQMIVVYISNSEYKRLSLDAQRAQNVITQNYANAGMPFQFQQKRKMKRDKSLIFSNIPEEGTCDVTNGANTTEGKKVKPMNRPNHLPLRFKNVTARDISESGIASINFDETDSYPEFIGRTSVCSTPMTENKVLHGNVMSICANPTEHLIVNEIRNSRATDSKRGGIKIDFEKFFSNFISNPHKMERRSSLTDIHGSLKKISKRMSLRQLSFGLPVLDVNKNGTETPDYIDDIDNTKTNRTITDPTYPMFNSNGEPISRSLFQEFLERYYTSWEENSKNDQKITKLLEEFKGFDLELQKLDSKIQDTTHAEKKDCTSAEEITKAIINNPPNRKSLTLPLKPLNDFSDGSSAGIFERKKLSGIQLTPLMTKLSVLALNEERSSGFCSWDTTPGLEIATPIDSNKLFRRKSSVKLEDTAAHSVDDESFHKVELYICGQQNMTLLLLIEEGGTHKQNLIQTMFDTCVSRLTRLEANLNQTLNVNVDGDKSEGGYSYICVDPKWDTLQRGGPWSPSDIVSLEFMHKDLHMKYPITDLLLRTGDSVLYGYKSGRTEIFYKQPANPQAGLPPPADAMGTIAMRAKRRLERDHSFILL